MDADKRKFSLDLRIVAALLLVIIAGMLLLWKPWSANNAADRSVEVTGEAKVTAVPDEFVFYPSYQFKDASKETALKQLNQKSDEVVKKLKELGVSESKIKSNSNGFDYNYAPERTGGATTYTLQITVTVGNKELAQKVQDYLVTTTPTGAVSPQANFSDKKRTELESKARDEATKSARAKAEQMGKNLGFKLGKVKSISDDSGFGGVMPFARGTELSVDDKKSLEVHPGENELQYNVTVVYFIR